jgi:hypothetical protein
MSASGIAFSSHLRLGLVELGDTIGGSPVLSAEQVSDGAEGFGWHGAERGEVGQGVDGDLAGT